MVVSLKNPLLLFFCMIPSLAFCNGGSITNNRYNTSLIGSAGSSGSFSASFGQLSFSTPQLIIFDNPDEYVAIPFNAFSLSNNVAGSTSPPATITILNSGVYQINMSLYFSSEDSDEGNPYTATTYTIGTSINGGMIVPCAAVYSEDSGYFSLNYSTIREFSANDYIQFHMKTLTIDGSIVNENIVTLEQGNANLVQIAE